MTIGSRTLSYKGSSLYTTIPGDIVEKLQLKEGEQLIFIHEDGKDFAIIGTKSMLGFKNKELKKLAPGALGFLSGKVDDDDLDLIMSELAKKQD